MDALRLPQFGQATAENSVELVEANDKQVDDEENGTERQLLDIREVQPIRSSMSSRMATPA